MPGDAARNGGPGAGAEQRGVPLRRRGQRRAAAVRPRRSICTRRLLHSRGQWSGLVPLDMHKARRRQGGLEVATARRAGWPGTGAGLRPPRGSLARAP